jgi:hypothetical protein
MRRDHDRIIRASRAIKHPGRNLQPASCIGAAQRAAEDDITRLVDRLMDEDWQTEPWMPPIQKLAKAGPVGYQAALYNPRRRHSSIGYLSPIDYERHAANPDAHQPAAVLAAVKDKPPGGPQAGPSLTAAARDGRTFVRAGMEEWLRRGPNKRMAPNRRAKCPQTRYPDPNPTNLHETGASPANTKSVLSRYRPGGAP